jgi:mRNA-degrading endonuclease RelE of RelBE toxin-antitoxin system
MGSFRISIQPSAEREFRAVPFPFRRQLNIRINKLKHDPAPPESEMVDERLRRLRIHGWRVVYDVDLDASWVTILAIVPDRP